MYPEMMGILKKENSTEIHSSPSLLRIGIVLTSKLSLETNGRKQGIKQKHWTHPQATTIFHLMENPRSFVPQYSPEENLNTRNYKWWG